MSTHQLRVIPKTHGAITDSEHASFIAKKVGGVLLMSVGLWPTLFNSVLAWIE